MEESSSESQPRCPCGFWGSAKTLGLCSVCYRKAHRTQSQGNSHTADASKTTVGTCYNQSHNSSEGKRMDSKHFPSRSTTDNLPSSLSSPPGERALTAAPSSPMDATTPTTSSGATTPSHMPTAMSTGGSEKVQAGTTGMTKSACDSLPASSDSETSCSGTSDQSYDPRHDTGICPSDSSSSRISVASSNAATFASVTSTSSSEEYITKDSQISGSQGPVSWGTLNTSTDSHPSMQSTSQATKSSGPNTDAIHGISNTVVSSSKNYAAFNSDKGEKQVDISVPHDKSSEVSANGSQPSTCALTSKEQVPVNTSIPSLTDRGIKRSRDEMEASSEEPSAPSPQKNKKRCFICSCKLELAQRTIGRCRCDRVFCALHRLPELHECDFNHKEDGRREAREKMVKPTRHLGPSYRREDHS